MRSGGALRALCQLGVALWIGVALSLVETSPTAEPMPEVETRAAPLQPQPSRSAALPSKPAEPTRVGGHEIDDDFLTSIAVCQAWRLIVRLHL